MRARLASVLVCLAVLPLVGAAPEADAQTVFDRFHALCLEELVIPELDVLDDIPVGCEIVDCCPGCPGPPIDWVIRVRGERVAAVELRFENLSVDPGRLAVEGARWDGDTLIVPPGTATLRGLPRTADGRPPVAVPRLRLRDDEGYRRSGRAAAGDPAEGDTGSLAAEAEVHVEQRIGRYVVNEYRAGFAWLPCPRGREDRVQLSNNRNGDSAVVLVDGRRSSGCVDDERNRGSGQVPVGNLRRAGGCRSETVVFSDGDAMQIADSTAVWTNATGDVQPVDLTPDVLRAPVDVWLLRPGAAFTALGDFLRAGNLFDGSNCGSTFRFGGFQDRSGNAGEVATMSSFGCAPAEIAALQASAIYTPGRLNAYYVPGAFTAFNCIADRNVAVVGTLANNQSLAHEFGHAYSLGHTNSIAGIPAANVMHGGGAGRTDFTEGQCFRTNVNPGSMLNANGVRSGPTRTCADATANAACPRLDLDVDPD